MYTIDRTASPPPVPKIDRVVNHVAQSASTSTSSSTSSNRSGYKLFPTIEFTPPPVRSRPTGPRRSTSYDDGFIRPASSDQRHADKTLATRRGRKMNFPLLKSKLPSVTASSPIPEVIITASSSPRNHTQLQAQIELGRSKSTGDEFARPKTAALDSRFMTQSQSPQASQSCSTAVKSPALPVAPAQVTRSSSAGPSTTGPSKRKLDEHLSSFKPKDSAGAQSSASPRSIHHTRQSSSLSTLGSDDVAYFGSAGLSTLSATKQCYSPVGTALQVREVMVAGPPKDRQQDLQQQELFKHTETSYVVDGSDSDTCVPPPLFTSRKRTKARRNGINGSSSNSSLCSNADQKGKVVAAASSEKDVRSNLASPEQIQQPKSAPPTQISYGRRPPTPTLQAVPTLIKFNSIQDLVEEQPVPNLPQANALISQGRSATAHPENQAPRSSEKIQQAREDAEEHKSSPAKGLGLPTEVRDESVTTIQQRPGNPRSKSAPQDKVTSIPSSTEESSAGTAIASISSPSTQTDQPSSIHKPTSTCTTSATNGTPSTTAPTRRSETKPDPMRRLIDLTRQTDALYLRYEALRTQRTKQTAALTALLKENNKSEAEYTELLVSRLGTALGATNASMDVCVAKLKRAGAKKEKAMAALIAQSRQQCGVSRDEAGEITTVNSTTAGDIENTMGSASAIAKDADSEKRRLERSRPHRESSTRRAVRSADVTSVSPYSDDEAIVSTKVRRGRMKAEMMSEAAAGISSGAVGDRATRSAIKLEGQVDVRRALSPAPVELAAELPASLLARGTAPQSKQSGAIDCQIQIDAREKVVGKRVIQHQETVIDTKARESTATARRPRPRPAGGARTAPSALITNPPARTPPPPPPPPKTPPRQIKTSYFPQQSCNQQEKPDSAIALSSSNSTLGGNNTGARAIATTSSFSSTTSSNREGGSSISGSSVISAGYSYSSSPREEHEAKTPRCSDDECYYHQHHHHGPKQRSNKDDHYEDRRIDGEESIPSILLPPASSRTRRPPLPRTPVLPERNPGWLAGKSEAEKAAVETKEKQQVQVLSGEAERFWEFCEGSFRLSRTPCGDFRSYG